MDNDSSMPAGEINRVLAPEVREGFERAFIDPQREVVNPMAWKGAMGQLLTHADAMDDEVAALRAQRDDLRDAVKACVEYSNALTVEYNATQAEVERMRPVVEAAEEWATFRRHRSDLSRDAKLADAVDAYRATSEQEATDG